MTIGTWMGQEICLIIGHRFHTIYFTLEETPDGYMWSGSETDEKAANIQARSFMARTLDEIGKK